MSAAVLILLLVGLVAAGGLAYFLIEGGRMSGDVFLAKKQAATQAASPDTPGLGRALSDPSGEAA